ncbi:50S ribosomal protein L6 [Sulfolobales archaeon HS-7]|nr:50S ribosomal protein L6 [Sulfolobales archaeon HS-7]
MVVFRAIYIKEEIVIPTDVSVDVSNNKVIVKGKKGMIDRDFSHMKGIIINKDNNKITIESTFLDKEKKAKLYSIIRHIENMFTGVTKGYKYSLKVVYSHFPISIKLVGDTLQVTNLIGEKNIRKLKIPKDIKVSIKGEDIVVEGIDKEKVGQVATNIERMTRIRDFDRRVFMDGIFIYGKEVGD